MSTIVIASRKSDLARIQAQSVAAALKKLDPSLEVELTYRESLGDLNQEDPLWKMPEKGVFTQDFREDLLNEKIDIVVHSWKDLPTEMTPETKVVGALPRADQRDLLLVKKSVLARGGKAELKILSSSPRRAYNLAPALKDLLPASLELNEIHFADIRGNVPTRVRKCLADDSADGLVLAKAGLDRLLSASAEEFQDMRKSLSAALQEFRWMVLPLSLNPTAAAQGALALEIKSTRKDLDAILAPLICKKTTAQVQLERKVLKSYGGGCHQKIGVSVIDHPLGALISLKGKTDDAKILDTYDVQDDYTREPSPETRWSHEASLNAQQRAAVAEQSYFPKSKAELLKIFERKSLHTDFERLRRKPLLVARANALPDDYAPGADQILWAAGVETWRSLAKRNYWVSGCCDALGEDHIHTDASLTALAPEQMGQFVRLTHDRSPAAAHSVATYTLVQRENIYLPKVTPKWFFWMSGSAFLWALEQNPFLRESMHSCGPGHTLDVILKHVPTDRVHVYPSYEVWLKQIERVAKGRSS